MLGSTSRRYEVVSGGVRYEVVSGGVRYSSTSVSANRGDTTLALRTDMTDLQDCTVSTTNVAS